MFIKVLKFVFVEGRNPVSAVIIRDFVQLDRMSRNKPALRPPLVKGSIAPETGQSRKASRILDRKDAHNCLHLTAALKNVTEPFIAHGLRFKDHNFWLTQQRNK